LRDGLLARVQQAAFDGRQRRALEANHQVAHAALDERLHELRKARSQAGYLVVHAFRLALDGKRAVGLALRFRVETLVGLGVEVAVNHSARNGLAIFIGDHAARDDHARAEVNREVARYAHVIQNARRETLARNAHAIGAGRERRELKCAALARGHALEVLGAPAAERLQCDRGALHGPAVFAVAHEAAYAGVARDHQVAQRVAARRQARGDGFARVFAVAGTDRQGRLRGQALKPESAGFVAACAQRSRAARTDGHGYRRGFDGFVGVVDHAAGDGGLLSVFFFP
jgi:hypothetical protein